MEYNFKVSNPNDDADKKRSISDIMEKHQKVHDNISSHLKKELTNQEGEFERKMERRRERSVSRSMNKSVDRKPSHVDALRESETGQITNVLQQLRISEQKGPKHIDNPFKDDF